MVQSVRRVEPELKLHLLPFRETYGLAGREIDIGVPRSTQDVPSRVAPQGAGSDKGGFVEVSVEPVLSTAGKSSGVYGGARWLS